MSTTKISARSETMLVSKCSYLLYRTDYDYLHDFYHIKYIMYGLDPQILIVICENHPVCYHFLISKRFCAFLSSLFVAVYFNACYKLDININRSFYG